MCANEQGQFFPYASALFAIEPATARLSADGYRQAAESVGLNVSEFTSCMDDGRNLDMVNTNRDRARAVGVSGTPTFFLNGEELSGAQPLSVFSQAIDALLTG